MGKCGGMLGGLRDGSASEHWQETERNKLVKERFPDETDHGVLEKMGASTSSDSGELSNT